MSRQEMNPASRAGLLAMLVGVLCLVGSVRAADAYDGAYDGVRSGVLERIDLADNSAIIGGLWYRMAPGLRVEINNSYGAFSMLGEGMFLRVYFVEPQANDRRAVFIEQLTDPEDWESWGE